MAEFGPEIAAEILAACEAGIDEAKEALARAFDGQVSLKLGDARQVEADALPSEFDAPGLVIVLKIEESAALIVLPESSGLLPDWYADPDPTGVSKLATLAQELGMILLPEQFMPTDFLASRVEHLGQAVQRGGIAAGAGLIPLTVSKGEQSGDLVLLWPAPAARIHPY